VRTLALTVLVALAAAAPAAASGVDVLVAGKSATLADRHGVPLRAVTVKAGGRRCRVAGPTALAVLARTKLALRLRDYGSCGRSPRDAAALFVRRIGPDANRGSDGWVYKVGHRASSRGAGDRGLRLKPGRRVLWFWCVMAGTGCQRTLEATPETARATAGSSLRVTVRGYDDSGRGVAVAGATVRLADAIAVTGADGVATLTVPDAPGRRQLVAEHDGMVRSFAETVTIG
jgi:hypothetical protein